MWVSRSKSFRGTKTVDIGVMTVHDLHEMSPGSNSMLSIHQNDLLSLSGHRLSGTVEWRTGHFPTIHMAVG
jgi:hypothetical protein